MTSATTLTLVLSTMTMNILNSSLRKLFLVAAAGAAIALLSTRASAQEVDFPNLGFSGSATQPFDLAARTGSPRTRGGGRQHAPVGRVSSAPPSPSPAGGPRSIAMGSAAFANRGALSAGAG